MKTKRSFLMPGLILLAVWLTAFYAVLRPAFLTWGATPDEAARIFPPPIAPASIEYQSTRALTVQAPPAKVWERFAQLGIGRSGFYSYAWAENLFLAGIRNDFRIDPAWQARPSGEFVRSFQYGAPKAGANGWSFDVLAPGTSFFLNPGWGPFVLEPAGEGATRLIVRSMTAAPLKLPVKAALTLLLDPIHFVMEKRMMLSVAALAEGRKPFSAPATAAAHLGFLLAALAAAGIILTRLKGKLWILVPLAWAAAVVAATGDLQSALAALTAGGLITAGFRLLGRRGWLFVLCAWIYAYLVLIYARDAYVFFGLAFWPLGLAAAPLLGLPRRRKTARAAR